MNSIIKEVIAEVLDPENMENAERRGRIRQRLAAQQVQLFRRRQRARQKKKN